MNYLQLTITVLGGLAMFVYGMGLMSEGLTQIAGARMKAVLAYVTRNRFLAIFAGAAVTALIQSSSATTVMTVGFVNAGLLTLQQAIGVVFGANIGTTVTGQLVSFKLDDLALPSIIIGVAGLLVSRKPTWRGAWRTFLGFGFLFFGMSMMSHELKAVAKLPEFVAVFRTFDCAPSAAGYLPFWSVLGAVAVGTLCTVLVQSSSATIGITIALAEAGLIDIWTAVPIVLGDNIGTTVTAALAAVNTTANARRTALAHALFNVIGTLILLSTFGFVCTDAAGVRGPAFYHLVNAAAEGDVFAGQNPGRHIAMAHTIFNMTNVAVLCGFIPLLARLCVWIIPGDRQRHTVLLEPHLLAAPDIALHAVTHALADMTRRAWTIASVALNNCLGKTEADAESMQKAEQEIDALQSSIRDYLVAVSQRKLTERQAHMIPELIHCANDAERISDLGLRIYRKTTRIRKGGIPVKSLADITSLINSVRVLARDTVASVREETPRTTLLAGKEEQIHRAAKALSQDFSQHMGNVSEKNAAGEIAFLSILSGLRDIARHLGNIAVRVPAFV
mgnify:FL=1